MKHAREDYNRIQDPEGKIGEDEPVFLLRAKDELFAEMLVTYAKLHAHRYGEKTQDIQDATLKQAELGRQWAYVNGSKPADL